MMIRNPRCTGLMSLAALLAASAATAAPAVAPSRLLAGETMGMVAPATKTRTVVFTVEGMS